MADGRELDEAAAPDGLVAEGHGVEAGGQFAAIAEPDADALGDGHPRAPEHAGEQVCARGLVAFLPQVSSSLAPLLVAPVSEFSTIEAGELR